MITPQLGDPVELRDGSVRYILRAGRFRGSPTHPWMAWVTGYPDVIEIEHRQRSFLWEERLERGGR